MKQNANKKLVNDLINNNYSKWLSNANILTKDKVKAEELLHTVLLRFLQQAEEKQKKICDGNLIGYINRSLWLSWYSSSSDYFFLYKKIAVLEYDSKYENAKDSTFIGAFIDGEYLYSAIGRLNEFDAILLRLYSKPDFDYKELSSQTGIPYAYLRTSIHRALKRIREYVKLQRAIAHSTREAEHLQKL